MMRRFLEILKFFRKEPSAPNGRGVNHDVNVKQLGGRGW